jgi:hypothetical protein
MNLRAGATMIRRACRNGSHPARGGMPRRLALDIIQFF